MAYFVFSLLTLYFVGIVRATSNTALSRNGTSTSKECHEPHDLLPLTRLPRPVRKGLGGIAKRLPKMKGKNFLIRGSKDLQERFIGNAFVHMILHLGNYVPVFLFGNQLAVIIDADFFGKGF